jgi:phosphinothricin acetyltransferase
MSRSRDIGPSGDGGIAIEPATEDDLPAIVGIVNYTAAHSIASFATRPVTVAERRDWFAGFAATGPYRAFVARDGDQVLGYACTQRYRDLDAFRETVEASIALDSDARGRGIGTLLYRKLIGSLADEPVHVVVAGIALPNDASVALHRKFGFTDVGVFREYAVKDGQYISSLWMQRFLP